METRRTELTLKKIDPEILQRITREEARKILKRKEGKIKLGRLSKR